MQNQQIFDFKKDISAVDIPALLNNPFELKVPEIAQIAANEFQEQIHSESKSWNYDFSTQKGKMFGVLVVQKQDKNYAYLGAVSGKLPGFATWDKLTPSVFDNSADDFFINKGMTELTEMGAQIKGSKSEVEIESLAKSRKQKSFALQQRLFENYTFSNVCGIQQNVLQIFEQSSHGLPPAAAGECAAPKLLQYAFEQG